MIPAAPAVSLGSLLLFLFAVALVAASAIAAVWRAWGQSTRATFLAALGVAVWLAATFALAGSGWLGDFSRFPPPFLIFFVVITLGSAALVFSPAGTRIVQSTAPAWLVGFQAFRIPVEWFLDRLYHEGVVPVQMTFEGRNFDIVAGVGALLVAGFCAMTQRAPRALLLVWSVVGLALLVNIVTIAILSAPGPLRVFQNEPANTFVMTPPFVWLPAFLVQAAWIGHLLLFRRVLGRWGGA